MVIDCGCEKKNDQCDKWLWWWKMQLMHTVTINDHPCPCSLPPQTEEKINLEYNTNKHLIPKYAQYLVEFDD